MNNLKLDIELSLDEQDNIKFSHYNLITRYFLICEKDKINNLIITEKSESELNIIYKEIEKLFIEFQNTQNYNLVATYLNHKDNLEKEIIKINVFISDLINKIEEDNKKNNVPLIS